MVEVKWTVFVTANIGLLIIGLAQTITLGLFLNNDVIDNSAIQPALEAISYDGSNPRSKSKEAAILGVSAGTFNIIIGILGLATWIGKRIGLLDNQSIIVFLLYFTISTGVLFILQLGSNGLCFRILHKMNSNETANEMQSALNEYYISEAFFSSSETSNAFNELFLNFRCCGVSNIFVDFDSTGWKSLAYILGQRIPRICCVGTDRYSLNSAPWTCYSWLVDGTYYGQGCFEAFVNEVESRCISMVVPGTISSAIQIIAVGFGIYIIRHSQREKE